MAELILLDGGRAARISCPVDLIPAPGQYLLAGDDSNAPLPVPLYCMDSAPDSVAVAPWRHFRLFLRLHAHHAAREIHVQRPRTAGGELLKLRHRTCCIRFLLAVIGDEVHGQRFGFIAEALIA